MDDSDLAGRVRALLTGPHVTEKKMFGGICFLFDGNMMLGASKRGLLVRVGKEGNDAALRKPATRPMEQGGRLVAGYIYVGDEGTRRDADLKAWIDLARAHVATVPPKAKATPAGRSAAKKPPATTRAPPRRRSV
jgi:TfoX/Sxy family transcriptional regulator of competence genes